MASLLAVMAAGGAAIWLFVVLLLLHAMRKRRDVLGEDRAARLIFWGGAVFPSATLVLLLAYALWLMPQLRPWPGAEDAARLRIEVVGEQYWWRVTYHRPDGAPIVSANEVRLPVGERVEFTLKSNDVIHSFWIPPLGGKMDMIPGRANRLSLEAKRAGIFRGPCAEYCGTSHALMALSAIAMERNAFEGWLTARALPSPDAAAVGRDLFLFHGCGACHAIKGTEAAGAIGPDLSHLGSRLTLAAGILENTEEKIARFIADPAAFKPGARMPAFGMLPPQDIRSIAAYLKGLQ